MPLQEQASGVLAAVRRTAPQFLARLQNGLSQPSFELVYTSNPRWPLPASLDNNSNLTISVLDSSFNPPTRAHLALAKSLRPENSTFPSGEHRDYDAKLLLLSVKNVDKSLKPADATYLQRLEMMSLLMHQLTSSDFTGAEGDSPNPANVAIGITGEPTFVGKSSALSQFLAKRISNLTGGQQSSNLELSFLLGLDTLERLFSSRYYASETSMVTSLRKFLSPQPDGDNCRIVSANRVVPSAAPTERASTDSAALKKELEGSGRITTIELDKRSGEYSSSAVRDSLGKGRRSSSGDEIPIWEDMVVPEVVDYIQEHRLYVPQP